MRTTQKVLGLTVVAAILGGVAVMAKDSGRTGSRVPGCYVDKDLNGKCDKAQSEGGECPKFHARPLTPAEKKQLEEMKKKAGATGDKKTLITCPGQGLCMACGLCNGTKV
jgi:hypothetical protein